jgi:dimeric dUTPase (all-alpha-NTP-PPase superfamily)
MNNIDLTSLYDHQAKLDAHIQSTHHVDYASTRQKRLLALLVELGELANETRVFKFWSLKARSSDAIILDEYADGLHFLLSLGIEAQSSKKVYTIAAQKIDAVASFLNTYQTIHALQMNFSATNLESAMQQYLDLISCLGYSVTQVLEAYVNKLNVNYQRQQNHY